MMIPLEDIDKWFNEIHENWRSQPLRDLQERIINFPDDVLCQRFECLFCEFVHVLVKIVRRHRSTVFLEFQDQLVSSLGVRKTYGPDSPLC